MTVIICIGILAIGAISDIKTKTIPMWLPVIGIIAGMGHVFLVENKWEFIYGGLFGIALFLLSVVLKDFGAGDGLMIMAIGLLRGLSICIEGYLISLFVLLMNGGVIMLVKGYKKKLCLPFIPYFLIGILAVELAVLAE